MYVIDFFSSSSFSVANNLTFLNSQGSFFRNCSSPIQISTEQLDEHLTGYQSSFRALHSSQPQTNSWLFRGCLCFGPTSLQWLVFVPVLYVPCDFAYFFLVGVLEGIRITRLGFPNRLIYAEFVKRYYLLVPDVPRNPQDPRPATSNILKGLKIPESEYRFGLTKVFFRAGQLAYIEVRH